MPGPMGYFKGSFLAGCPDGGERWRYGGLAADRTLPILGHTL